MFKKTSKCLGTSAVTVLHYYLSPTPSNSSAMKTPQNIEEDPDNPEPAD
jgi:hypothetical protein